MELLKLGCPFTDEDGKKPAIILCSQNKVLMTVTYSIAAQYADTIRQFMLKNIKTDYICVGLLMEKNIYIPSIISSFQELAYSFVFLTSQTLTKAIQNLNIKWVLSYECNALTENFILEDTLEFSTKDELKLWKNRSYSENVQTLCFKGIFCVVQTSGSTGENKIVRVPHSCIECNVLSLNKHFGLSDKDVIYWGTPLTFDPTLVEFLLGVFCRAPLVIVPKLVVLNPKFLYDALFKIEHITFLQMVPSVFLRWSNEQIGSILYDSCLRTLALGGEPFPQELLRFKYQNELKLFNLYGVTELSCWATISNITLECIKENQVSLGKALDETFIELRDNDEVIQSGVGEICIGSNTRYCLLNNSNQNLNFPFVIKTGDLGEFNKHGLVYKGRKTRIFKRFGHKVNLNKIEEIIFQEINLLSRFVYSVQHKKLLAFMLIQEYFSRNTKVRLLDKLRVKLLKIISETEFPDWIDVVNKFPLNEHGKICDRSLEKYYENSLSNLVVEENNSKDVFVDILDRYLKTDFSNNVETLGKCTFFELGGNSILAIQLLSEFKEYIGRDIPGELVTLILNENIHSCMNYLPNIVSIKRKLLEAPETEEPKKRLLVASKELNVIAWTYNLKGCVDSSPIVFQKSGEIYIASGSFAHIFAILKENGEEYLKLTLPQEVEAKPCASKCGKFVFIGCSNGSMYCIDLSVKNVIWEYSTSQKISSAACLCQESKAVAFGSYDSFVYCVTTENGALLWKTNVLGSIRTDPVYSENLKIIYVGTTKGMCYALKEQNGTVIWSYELNGPIFGSPCLVRGCVMWPCVTGVVYSISSTGDFKSAQNIEGNLFSSLTVYENKVYFGCHDSKVYELIVDDNDIRISNRFQLESEISSTPYVYKFENKLLIVCICNIGILYAIDLESGEKLLEYQLPAPSFSSPYVFNDMIYVGCRDNNLYCIDIKKAVIK